VSKRNLLTTPVEGFLCFAHSLLRKLCYPLMCFQQAGSMFYYDLSN
jgi:hypothetical protein